MNEESKPKLVAVNNPETGSEAAEPSSIAKPASFDLNRFRSKTPDTIAGVQTLLTALPVHSIADALDFVRLHKDEEKYWSYELCFVDVPIKGQKRDTLHLIDEDLAMRHLPSRRILRFRLALAAKPDDVFFLCQIPSRNLDNPWNSTNLDACELSKTQWVQATSRKAEGFDSYQITHTRDENAFPDPQWPKQSLGELIGVTFTGRCIEQEDHPALARLIGAKPKL
jgi:hypothetical protein